MTNDNDKATVEINCTEGFVAVSLIPMGVVALPNAKVEPKKSYLIANIVAIRAKELMKMSKSELISMSTTSVCPLR